MSSEHFHGGHEVISEIRADGVFGGIFGASKEAARSHGSILHVIESPRPLSDFELNYEIDGAYEIALELSSNNESLADAIMSKGCEVPEALEVEPEDAGDMGWEIQRLRGKLASRLGYTSVEMLDEHGTIWLCLPGCTISVYA
jgi:hypothetical protein